MARTGEREAEPIVAPSAGARWRTATEQVRTTAQWVIVTAGVVAGAVFVAGPVIAGGELEGDHLWWRAAGIVGCAVLGAAGVTYLIARVAAVLLPYETQLGELSPRFVKLVEAEPDQYLPNGIQTIGEFRTELDHRSRSVLGNQREIERLRAKREAQQAERELLAEDVVVKTVELERVEAQLAATVGKKKRGVLEQTAWKLRSVQGDAELERESVVVQMAADQADLDARERAQKQRRENLELFESARAELLAQAAYAQTSLRFVDKPVMLALAPVIAVAAGAGYLILWSYTPP